MAKNSQDSKASFLMESNESENGNSYNADNRKTEQGGSPSTSGKEYIEEIPEHMPKAEIAKDRLRFWVSLIVFCVILYFLISFIISLIV